jgi:Phytanoyl-CoA dioxygenase (PhyH)
MHKSEPPSIAATEEIGRLGIRQVKRFWSLQLAGDPGSPDGSDWVLNNTLLAGLQLGLQETIHYILKNRPAFEEFENSILEANGGSLDPALVARLNSALSEEGVQGQPADPHADPVLSAADLEFWNKNGYVVIHDAVPPENCTAAAICDFLGAKLDDPSTWYGLIETYSAWVPLMRHPALAANRQSPRIRRAFAQIWNREDLWVNTDQSGFNPPETDRWKFPNPRLHLDVSLARPIPFGVQGILYLNDTPAEQGAFTCVPGFHHHLETWLETMPKNAEPRSADFSAHAVPIAGRAGDFISGTMRCRMRAVPIAASCRGSRNI